MPELRRARAVVVGSETIDFTGEEAFEGGREEWSPTKNGHVGVLLLCSFLHCQPVRECNIQRIVFWFPAVETNKTIRTIDHILTVVGRSIVETRSRHLRVSH
jgi:hypothetical protein